MRIELQPFRIMEVMLAYYYYFIWHFAWSYTSSFHIVNNNNIKFNNRVFFPSIFLAVSMVDRLTFLYRFSRDFHRHLYSNRRSLYCSTTRPHNHKFFSLIHLFGFSLSSAIYSTCFRLPESIVTRSAALCSPKIIIMKNTIFRHRILIANIRSFTRAIRNYIFVAFDEWMNESSCHLPFGVAMRNNFWSKNKLLSIRTKDEYFYKKIQLIFFDNPSTVMAPWFP